MDPCSQHDPIELYPNGPKAGDSTECSHEFGMGHEGVTPHTRVAQAAGTPLSQIAGRQEETCNGPF